MPRDWPGRVDRVDRVLADCPADLRGWEWRYLKQSSGASRWPSSATPERSGTPPSAPTAAGWRRPASTTRSSCGMWPPVRLERTLRGHEERAYSVGFDKDGSRLVSASADKTAIIWDVATGKALHVLRGHVDNVRCAAFSFDGSTVVTGSWDGQLRAWYAGTGRVASSLYHERRLDHAGRVQPRLALGRRRRVVGPGRGLGHLLRPRYPDVREQVGAGSERRLQPRRLADRHDQQRRRRRRVKIWDVLCRPSRFSRSRSVRG